MKGLYSVLEKLPFKTARRIVIFILGVSVMLIGGALLVLPGPGLGAILIGLAILATEFLWARRLLRKLKATVDEAGMRVQQRWFPQPRREAGENGSAPGASPRTGRCRQEHGNTPGPE